MALTWVKYPKSITPTTAANYMAETIAALIKAGEQRKLTNAGQGREQTTPEQLWAEVEVERQAALARRNAADKNQKSDYNKAGGNEFHRTTGAAWIKHMVGFEGETFMLPQTGRAGFDQFCRYAVATGRGNYKFILPTERWTMLDKIIAISGMQIHPNTYNLERGKLPEAIASTTAALQEGTVIYIDSPSNPKSLIATEAELNGTLDIIESRIKSGGTKPLIFFDIPYFHSATQREEPGKSALDMGFTPEFFKRLRDMNIEWGASFSFSKALGNAQGLSFYTVSENVADKAKEILDYSSVGISYKPEEFDAYAKVLFAPDRYEQLLRVFADYRENHECNIDAFNKAFKPAESTLRSAFGTACNYQFLIESGVGVVRLVRFPLKELIDRTVNVSPEFGLPGNRFTIKEPNDFFELQANQYGFVAVNQGISTDGKDLLARISNAPERNNAEDGCKRFVSGMLDIAGSQRSPKVV